MKLFRGMLARLRTLFLAASPAATVESELGQEGSDDPAMYCCEECQQLDEDRELVNPDGIWQRDDSAGTLHINTMCFCGEVHSERVTWTQECAESLRAAERYAAFRLAHTVCRTVRNLGCYCPQNNYLRSTQNAARQYLVTYAAGKVQSDGAVLYQIEGDMWCISPVRDLADLGDELDMCICEEDTFLTWCEEKMHHAFSLVHEFDGSSDPDWRNVPIEQMDRTAAAEVSAPSDIEMEKMATYFKADTLDEAL